jgi:hypothetical protein
VHRGGTEQSWFVRSACIQQPSEPEFLDRLPFVPPIAEFSAAPNILQLLVEPLYGWHPEVAVRELMQNGVDAVRELVARSATARIADYKNSSLSRSNADVLVEFVKHQSSCWILRVTDIGIGMDAKTIRNYFLRAGASIRQSPDGRANLLMIEERAACSSQAGSGLGPLPYFYLASDSVSGPGEREAKRV